MSNDQDKVIFGVVRISDKGQIVIPKDARDVFGLKPGDSLLVLGDKTKGIALVKTKVFDDVVEEVFR
jgi:AbrB family looped-hinge helix DNA binding protein